MMVLTTVISIALAVGLFILLPYFLSAWLVEYIRNDDGEEQDSAPHPQQHIHINSDLPLKTGDILRKLR